MELFYILLVLLLITRLFGELAVRLKQPALVGELVSGIALGMVVRHYSGTFPVLADLPDNNIFHAITDLAIFFLMLLAGVETHPRELAKVSGSAFLIAVGGMTVPLAAGLGLGWLYIPDSEYKMAQSLFIATALAITAVPVAVKVLIDLDMLKSRMGQTIVSAAVFDDIISLLMLGVLTAVIRSGEFPDAARLGWLLGQSLLFFVIAGLVGQYAFPWIGKLLKSFHASEIEFSALLIGAFGFALLAEALGMHFILGAFVAGLFFIGRTVDRVAYDNVKTKISGITEGFLGPLFFASIGMHLDPGAALSVPGFVVLVTAAAFLCKLIGAGVPAWWMGYSRRESLGIGVCMSARGAVELIIADIALRAGLFHEPTPTPTVVEYLFSTVVIMALATTLLTPIVLTQIVKRMPARRKKQVG